MYKKIYMIITYLLVSLLCACGDETKLVSVESQSSEGEKDYYESDLEAVHDSFNIATTGDAISSNSDMIAVYVCGAVASPGVYYLGQDSIVFDALDKAGGMLDDAATEYVNLARRISDGEKIYFPYSYELEDYSPIADSGNGSAHVLSGYTLDESDNNGLININTADVEGLMTLPGIGASKADAIIRYRQEQGTFAGIEDIQRVSGIGESTYNNIKERITVK